MAISTYAELQTAVANWVNRDDLTARIPEFIVLAEAQMNRELRVRRMLARDTATISSEYSVVPSDFLAARSMALDDAQLRFVDPADIVEMVTATTAAGKPTHYSVVGSEFRYFPAPDADYEAELLYWEKIPALSDANTSNWVLANHPDAYLFGALVYYATFDKDQGLLSTASAVFQSVLEAIRTADISESYGDRRRLKRQSF